MCEAPRSARGKVVSENPVCEKTLLRVIEDDETLRNERGGFRPHTYGVPRRNTQTEASKGLKRVNT